MVLRSIKIWVRRKLYPSFDCEDCIGMMRPHGCYCAAMDCFYPGSPPPRYITILRRLLT